MSFDETLAKRVRRVLADHPEVEEKRMFGGIAFMVRGHMACGLVADSLMVRVNPTTVPGLLGKPHTRPMDFTGRPMRGFLFVDAPGVASLAAVRTWVGRALRFVEGQPPKHAGPRPTRTTPPR
jgi:TfoX N-terminal domain